jgi:hypothetical protein
MELADVEAAARVPSSEPLQQLAPMESRVTLTLFRWQTLCRTSVTEIVVKLLTPSHQPLQSLRPCKDLHETLLPTIHLLQLLCLNRTSLLEHSTSRETPVALLRTIYLKLVLLKSISLLHATVHSTTTMAIPTMFLTLFMAEFKATSTDVSLRCLPQRLVGLMLFP